MLKTLIVYSHLLATCLALGSVLVMDFRLWRWRNRTPDGAMLARMRETQAIATVSLVVLWLTGAGLVTVGYWLEGMAYLMNEKVWAKLVVVSLLTMNGVLLHRIGFPALQQKALMSQPRSGLVLLGVLGAISTTSWLFAAFLGIARPWSHSLAVGEILAVFLAILGLAVLTAAGVSYRLGGASSEAVPG
ncbi:MAG: hypothetical protein R3276_10570 [Marinobacter sp.]|nr:hypothetical protein [Marinobacter sp.]